MGELGKATDTLDATGSVTLETDFGNTASSSHSFISIQQPSVFIKGIQIVFLPCRAHNQGGHGREAEIIYW